MYVGSDCNGIYSIGLLDYAYLALNVYRSPSDLKLLGKRPRLSHGVAEIKKQMQSYDGWYHLDFPSIKTFTDRTFYAELYVKTYLGKIQHIMVAFRGTATMDDVIVDAGAWWKTIFPGGKHWQDAIPSYWKDAHGFLMRCRQVIAELDAAGLCADFCKQHITGHSLGGAIANLVVASGVHLVPIQSKSTFSITPNVISFNAPGIGTMPHLQMSAYNQAHVITMRAKYDIVSTLGAPYGYVVNNFVEEGSTRAKLAFTMQEDLLDHKPALDYVIDDVHMARNAMELGGEVAIGLMGCLQQHKMSHLMELIANDKKTLSFNAMDLYKWAKQHGGDNHDFSAPCFYTEKMAKAA